MEGKAKLEAAVAKHAKELERLHAQRAERKAEANALSTRRPELLRKLASGRDVAGEVFKLNMRAAEIAAEIEGLTLLATDTNAARLEALNELQGILNAEAKQERERHTAELRERAEANAARVRELYAALCEARGALLLTLSELQHHDRPGAQGIAAGLVADDPLRQLTAAGWRELSLPGLEGTGAWACPALVAPDPAHPFKGDSPVLDAELVRVERAQAAATP